MACSIDLDRSINSEFIRDNQVKSAKLNAPKAQKNYYFFAKSMENDDFCIVDLRPKFRRFYKLLRFFTQNFHDFEKKIKFRKKIAKI